MTDEAFNQALDYTIKRERGFVDDPDDSGGPTNFGITQADLSAWRGHPVSIEDVKNLTKAEVSAFYFTRFWRPIAGDQLLQLPVAMAVFDAAVLFGTGASILCAQKALRDCKCDTISLDSFMGPKSIDALNDVNISAFITNFRAALISRAKHIATRYPKDAKFQAGWENRANHLLTLISQGGVE